MVAIKKIVYNLRYCSTNGVISAWVAPGICCIGEFMVHGHTPVTLKWSEQLCYSGKDDLSIQLQTVVKKRMLQGRPVILSLSLPEIYSIPLPVDSDIPVEEQEVLPAGILWDDIEYSQLKTDSVSVFTCIRQSNIDSWNELFKNIGLVMGSIIPSGIQLQRFFDTTSTITCLLPSGSLSCFYDTQWSGTCFVPAGNDSLIDQTIVFSDQVQAEYNWCKASMIPALEGVLSFIENPGFNLNPMSFDAATVFKTEKFITTGIYRCSIGFLSLAVILLLLFGVSDIVRLKLQSHQGGQASTASIKLIKKDNSAIKARLAAYNAVLSNKSSIAVIMHDIGALAGDSIWYSELKLNKNGNTIGISIIGHSFSESSIAKLLLDSQNIRGVTKTNLEYAEKLSQQQAAKLTSGRLQCELYRFKIILNIVAS